MAKLTLIGYVGWDWRLTQEYVHDKLEAIPDGEPIDVYIDSGGGYVSDGYAIYGMLNQKAKTNKITVHIGAYGAYSMAGIISQVGHEVTMIEGSTLHIHTASGYAWGNAKDLEKSTEQLKHYDGEMFKIYALRYKGDIAELIRLVDEETDLFLSAEQAFEYGLIDYITPLTSNKDNEEYKQYENQATASTGMGWLD